MLTSLLLMLAAAPAIAPATAPAGEEPDAMHMSASEIRAFNASVPPAHPFHIRCRRDVETGSLVRSTRICRTNSQWVRAETVGNKNARDTLEAMTSKYMNGENPPTGDVFIKTP